MSLKPGAIREVGEADKRWLETVFTGDDGVVFDLTGYDGWYSFWKDGATPHVIRAGIVVGAQGIVRYRCLGDEYTPAGVLVYRQVTVKQRDFGSAVGRMFVSSSSTPVARRVVRRPA